ncbi:MAG: CHAP domain-containing protein [Rhodanobacter sp.]
MTTPYQEQWLNTAVGRATDRDGDSSYDCVDVPKDYAESIWANTSWRDVWPQAGNAKDMLWPANTEYVDIIANDAGNPNLIPQRGDIIVYGGNNVNMYGHIAVVTEADPLGVDVIQEDSFLQTPMAAGRLGYDNYGTGLCIGWLRPKFDGVSAAIAPQALNVTPITPQEDDMPEYKDWSPESKRQLQHDLWFGLDGGQLVQNRRLGRGEWPETILGSLEDRIQNEILPQALAGIKATVDPAALAAAIPDSIAKAVSDELAKRLAS